LQHFEDAKVRINFVYKIEVGANLVWKSGCRRYVGALLLVALKGRLHALA
jgi:hypothetical protein